MFGLSKVDNMVTLKSVASIKALKNVLPDAELSFHQMSMAKNAFIPLMTKYQWSNKAINSFVQLFTQLELHPYRHVSLVNVPLSFTKHGCVANGMTS